MAAKASKKQKPEDMLIRVIRVAEILAKGHTDTSEQATSEAKPVDSGENLIVMIPDDNGVSYRVETVANRPPCTNAVQTYVDLASAGGRGEEAAEAILQQRLKPVWSAASR